VTCTHIHSHVSQDPEQSSHLENENLEELNTLKLSRTLPALHVQ
jgi:hypothetical protein